MLDKTSLQQSLSSGIKAVFLAQSNKATTGAETEDPIVTIQKVSNDLATVIANSVDAYVKKGDIYVDAPNVQVISTAPGTPAVVTRLRPTKIQ